MARAASKSERDFRFRPGDRIRGADSAGIPYRGTVELIDKKQRILWIHTEAGGRKLIDDTEHTIDHCD